MTWVPFTRFQDFRDICNLRWSNRPVFIQNFTAIIGPNGSGKSNVIDAMLFVFGFRATKIRSKKVSVLIHNSDKHRDVRSCTVNVHFQRIIDLVRLFLCLVYTLRGRGLYFDKRSRQRTIPLRYYDSSIRLFNIDTYHRQLVCSNQSVDISPRIVCCFLMAFSDMLCQSRRHQGHSSKVSQRGFQKPVKLGNSRK